MSLLKKLRTKVDDVRLMNELLPTAERLAAADGVDEGGAEYLVMAALDLDEGSAARAFARVGLAPSAFRQAVQTQHADALASAGLGVPDSPELPPPAPASGLLRTGPSSHRLFRATFDEVRDRGLPLSGATVLAVACRDAQDDGRGTTARALRRLGVDLIALEAAALEEAGHTAT